MSRIETKDRALRSMQTWLKDEIAGQIAGTCCGVGPYYPLGRDGPPYATYDLSTMDEASKPYYRALKRRLAMVEKALRA